MSQFILDYSLKKTMRVSNDAFLYLLEEEEPLDEKNLEEAHKILLAFPYGFYIDENWKVLGNSGLIECTFIPYTKNDISFDEYENITNNIQQQLKWLNPNCVRIWWYNIETGARELRGDFNVYTTKNGGKCFHTGDQNKEFIAGKMSLYFLKHFKKK